MILILDNSFQGGRSTWLCSSLPTPCLSRRVNIPSSLVFLPKHFLLSAFIYLVCCYLYSFATFSSVPWIIMLLFYYYFERSSLIIMLQLLISHDNITKLTSHIAIYPSYFSVASLLSLCHSPPSLIFSQTYKTLTLCHSKRLKKMKQTKKRRKGVTWHT